MTYLLVLSDDLDGFLRIPFVTAWRLPLQ